MYSVQPGDSDFENINGNLISATHAVDGIDACSSNNSITGNTVNGSDQSGIHLDSTCTGPSTGNTVSSNTINGACAGVLEGPGSGTVGANKFYNTATLVLQNSDTCTPPLVPQQGKSKAGRASVEP